MRTDKEEAIRLRKQGKSYNDICSELGMSKSTLSSWFKGIDFSEGVRKSLIEESKRTSSARIIELNKIRGIALKASYEVAEQEAIGELEKYKDNPLFIAAIIAYWGEGDKVKNGQVRLINVDPKMIKLFKTFLLDVCGVPNEKIYVALYIYHDLDEQGCKSFWSKETGVTRFHKTMVLPSRHKRKKVQNGICSIGVSNTYLKRKMLMWIDQLPEMVLNRVLK